MSLVISYDLAIPITVQLPLFRHYIQVWFCVSRFLSLLLPCFIRGGKAWPCLCYSCVWAFLYRKSTCHIVDWHCHPLPPVIHTLFYRVVNRKAKNQKESSRTREPSIATILSYLAIGLLAIFIILMSGRGNRLILRTSPSWPHNCVLYM